MTKEEKAQIIADYKQSENDCGSCEVQVAVLTKRILDLTEHLKINKKDNSTRRGLMSLVNRRRRLLAYLMKKDFARYTTLIKRLGLRH